MIQAKEHKHETENKPIERMPLPAKVYVPLSQHLGKLCVPEVKIADAVTIGQRIADVQSNVSAPIHSSICGKVTGIVDWPHPVLNTCKTIVIENDGQNTSLGSHGERSCSEINNLTPDEIRTKIFEAGVVGMGGAGFPSHIKLNPPKPVDTLIINGAECEPYLTSDYRLMIEKTKGLLVGVNIVRRCLGVKKVYIAIEDNKPEAIRIFRDELRLTTFELRVLRSAYPQGGEKQLIKSIVRKEVPRGKLPFDVGVIVHNVATVYAIFEAVAKEKPLYERVVTVSGDCISNTKNVLVPLGALLKDVIDFCGPLKKDPYKLIIGGPMMGLAQYTDEAPVIKTTSGILLLSEKEAGKRDVEYCIRCGACVRACPMGLMPNLINLASENEDWDEAKAYGALDCIECGACNFTCPARRRLTQSVKRAKFEVSK